MFLFLFMKPILSSIKKDIKVHKIPQYKKHLSTRHLTTVADYSPKPVMHKLV